MTRLLTVEEVAERSRRDEGLGVGAGSRRPDPHVQLGRYRRFREEALDRWLEDLELRGGAGQRSARR